MNDCTMSAYAVEGTHRTLLNRLQNKSVTRPTNLEANLTNDLGKAMIVAARLRELIR